MNHENAEQLIDRYFTLQTQKAETDKDMKEVKAQLEAFARDNEERFVDGIYDFDCCGYLRWGKRSVVKLNRSRFDLLRLVKAFPEYLKKEFSISAIKASFVEDKNRKKAKELGLTLSSFQEFEIVRKDKVEDLATGEREPDYNAASKHELAEKQDWIQRNLK